MRTTPWQSKRGLPGVTKKGLSWQRVCGMVWPEAMSEFKFACPVCGQHITSDSSASGTQLECPTCFQKIVVPQAPASGDSKLILSASQVAKPRPTQAMAADLAPIRPGGGRGALPGLALLALGLACVGGGVFFVMHGRASRPGGGAAPVSSNAAVRQASLVAAKAAYPVPTNFSWTLALDKAVFPEGTAAGRIHGSGFFCERATLQGGTLGLRQGRGWPPELGLTVVLGGRRGEGWSGTAVEVRPDRAPPVPRVVLRWKDERQQPVSRTFTGGYALKVVFGRAANGRMPGKIYICLPDNAKSFVAGSFDAEIRKPQPRKPRAPKTPRKL